MNANLTLTRRSASIVSSTTGTSSFSPPQTHTTNLTPIPLISSANNDCLVSQQTSNILYSKLPTEDHHIEELKKDSLNYTIDDAIGYIGVGWFQYRLLFLTGMINAADAMEMMLLSFLLPKLKKDWDISPPWDGVIGAVVFIGQLLGTSTGAILADKYGRKYIVIFANLGCALFGTLSSFAPNLTMMLCFRFMVGFFVGGGCCGYTLFAEYCPKHNRGSLLVIEQSFWAFGALFSVCLAAICFDTQMFKGENDWRYYLFFTSVPLWIIAMFYHIVPESSRWYLAANNTLMAQKMLDNVSKINNKPLPKGKLKRNTNNVSTRIGRGRVKDIFCVKQYKSTSMLLYIIFWCSVFGYYGISFLSERYFELFDSLNVYWEMTVSTSAEIPSLLLGLFMLDRFGRKLTMICNFAVFAMCCIGLTLFDNIGYYGLFGVFLARMSISLSFMTIYIYFSEYYPTVIRSTALGCASACGRFAGMATSFISQDFHIKTALTFYAISGCVGFICTNLLKQDTLGKDLATSLESQIMEVNKLKVIYDDNDIDKSESDEDYL